MALGLEEGRIGELAEAVAALGAARTGQVVAEVAVADHKLHPIFHTISRIALHTPSYPLFPLRPRPFMTAVPHGLNLAFFAFLSQPSFSLYPTPVFLPFLVLSIPYYVIVDYTSFFAKSAVHNLRMHLGSKLFRRD